ncbi:MAG: hypothetical protein R3A44_08450 [Caldilineaceae bacterium]
MTTNNITANRMALRPTALATMPVEQRLRLFYLALSAFMCLGVIAELLLLNHTDGAVQLIPFVLSGLGFVTVLGVIFKPGTKMVWTMRIVMIMTILGSGLGMFEHLEGNLEFAREIHSNLSGADLMWKALAGANPLLAPGMLAVGALIAIAASYYPATQS